MTMLRLLLLVSAVGIVGGSAAIAGAMALAGPQIADGSSWSFSPDEGIRIGPGEELDWSSPVETHEIAWTAGDAIEIFVPADIVYTQSPTTSLKVTGPKAVIDQVVMDDGDLRIEGGRRVRWGDDQRLKIVMSAPTVKNFTTTGATRIEILGYAQDDLSIEVNGTAHIVAKGKTNTIELEMNGAGDIDLAGVAALDANVEINGAGAAKISATNNVNVEINGAGAVDLAVDPQNLDSEINGIGTVNRPSGKTAKAEPISSSTTASVPPIPPVPPVPPAPPPPPAPKKL